MSHFYLLGVNRVPSDANAVLSKFALVVVFKAAAAAIASPPACSLFLFTSHHVFIKLLEASSPCISNFIETDLQFQSYLEETNCPMSRLTI